ncbi:uncharacterized protein G2W53_008164 [Senna tora]|uniref:Uncharacterized protein n=1 Tax=Senna tora TaxID=362788 RepID=A0A834X882_9FABA|nr:uncharacterized protein G2W53_008164 [Senna tora]
MAKVLDVARWWKMMLHPYRRLRRRIVLHFEVLGSMKEKLQRNSPALRHNSKSLQDMAVIPWYLQARPELVASSRTGAGSSLGCRVKSRQCDLQP